MARITNTELLKKYREKSEQSRRWRVEERYDDLWSRLIDLYRGKHHRTDIKEDQLLVNIAFATINVISPAVSINQKMLIKLLLLKPSSTIGGNIMVAKNSFVVLLKTFLSADMVGLKLVTAM